MRMLVRVGIAVWSGALLVGCAHAPADVAVGSTAKALQSFMPLAVGNRWTYATSFQGHAQPDLTVSIARLQAGYFLDDQPKPAQYRFDGEGLRDGNKRYILKAPIQVGTEWMAVADLNTVERYRIVDADRKVQVPAGVFSGCVVVQMEVRIDETRALRNEMTFAPDVGIIEVRILLKDGAKFLLQSLLQLKVFEPKGRSM